MSTTTTLFGSAEAQAARDLIGGTAIGELRNELLKQILVATANKTGGSSSVAFADITGAPGDNAALAAALATKLDLAGGTMTGALTIDNGTLTASAPALVVHQTLNNGAVVFNGASIGVTKTAAAAGSSILTLFGGAAGTTARWKFLEDGSFVPGADAVYKIGSFSTPLRPSADLFNVTMANCDMNGYLTTSSFIWLGVGAAAKLYGTSAGVLQLGATHATTPTAQTFTAHDVTTGTGASLTLQGGSGSVARGAVVLNGGNRAAYDASPSATVIRDILISHGLMAAS